jgi:hypothetical protein
VKAEKIWIPTEEEEEDTGYNTKLMKNGKKNIGSIFCLEKINREKQMPKEIKLESLNLFGSEILNFYEMNDEVSDE